MADPNVRIKRSGVSNKRPTLSDLNLGELGLNFYDGYLFAQRDTAGVGIGTTIALLTPWTENFGGTSIYYNNSVGIGTTNPGSKLTVNGPVQIQQDSGSNNRLIFRGQPESSYRWNIDNYSSSNQFRIFREDDATAANGSVAVSISTTGTVTANKFSGDGSLLTGIVASGSGVAIQDDTSPIGTASTINFGQNLTASLSNGVATINGLGSPWVETLVGIHTLSNVGIGITNPTSKLTVSGDASITGILTADQVYTSNNGGGQNIRIGDDFWLGDVNVADTTRFSGAQDSTRAFIIFGSSDAVALGRTGTGPLYYGGDFTISGVATANSFRARGGAPGALGVNNNGYGFFSPGDNDSGMYSSADGQIEFYTNNTEAVRIDSNQRVGIGTTNPTSLLQVGSVGASGTSLSVNGDVSIVGVVSVTSLQGQISITNSGNLNATRNVVLSTTTSGNSPLIGDLDLTYNTITNILTAGSFSGSGGLLTNLNASNISSGTLGTSRLSGTYDINISGIATYATLSGISTSVIGGIASVSQLNVSGVSTIGDVLYAANGVVLGTTENSNEGLVLGGSSQTGELYYNSASSRNEFSGTNTDFYIRAKNYTFATGSSGPPAETAITITQDGSVSLYYDNSKKFETIGAGITITGTTFTNQLSVSGVSTITDITTNTNINSSGIHTAQQFVGNINAGVGTITNITGTNLNYTGVSTITDIRTNVNINSSGIHTAQQFVGNINAGVGTITNITGTNLNYTGISTITDIRTNTNINSSGIHTALGGFNIGIQSGGVSITTGVITAINFVGTGNTFSYDSSSKIVSAFISGGSGSGIGTQWVTNSVGLHTLSNVGIGTTNPTSKLQIQGNTNINNTLPTTVSFASSFSVNSQDTEPREVSFSNDGGTMYVLGNAGNDISYYTLSTPWNITTASFVSQFSVASQTTVPYGLTFKPDGTKFYVTGTTGTIGAGATSVSEYSCTTPWDLTTAGFTTAFSVISEDSAPHDIEFSTDGTKFYVVGDTNNAIFQYTCTTPWSIASGVSVESSFSVSSQEGSPQGLAFSNDGTKLLLTGSSGDDINYYTLSTPWNITTASFVSVITAVGTGILGEGGPSGLYWKPDGTKLYLTGTTLDRVYEFNMTSDAQLEVAGKTLLYGDAEVHQNLNVYGKSYFGNNVGIGITNPTTKLHVNGDILSTGSVTSTSDENLKVNVQTITNALSKVLSLRGVEYDRIDTKDHQIGVIAQEVEKIVPEVVYPKTDGINSESKSVSYGNLVGLLIEAIKEQQAQIDELNQKLLNR